MFIFKIMQKCHQIVVEMWLFADDLILYTENPKESIQKQKKTEIGVAKVDLGLQLCSKEKIQQLLMLSALWYSS